MLLSRETSPFRRDKNTPMWRFEYFPEKREMEKEKGKKKMKKIDGARAQSQVSQKKKNLEEKRRISDVS